jgi:hypothetical protein
MQSPWTGLDYLYYIYIKSMSITELVNAFGMERRGLRRGSSSGLEIERWFLTLKSECLWLQNFGTLEEARREIDQFIDAYNRKRPHRALGMLAPSQWMERFLQNGGPHSNEQADNRCSSQEVAFFWSNSGQKA